jgi:hypothetical protein
MITSPGALRHPLPRERVFGERAAALSGLAARLLGWRPTEFWAATPAELASALSDEQFEPLAGDEIERLMQRYPDKVE